MKFSGRRSWRSFVTAGVGVVSLAMVATVAPTAQAAGPATGVVTAAAPTSDAKTVLKSEFGKAKSRVVGTFGTNGTVTGTFTPRRFRPSGDGERLVAVGRLTTTLTRGSGKVVGTESQRVAIPVKRAEGIPLPTARTAALAPGDCDVLNLVLGPLDLDVLGLQVHLDRVILNIIAASGAGNLLGNLLCAVAGLLDGGIPGLLGEISRILNSILAILRL